MTSSVSTPVTQNIYKTLHPIFAKITQQNWNQDHGYFYVDTADPDHYKNQRCCVGAHIAAALDYMPRR